MTYQDDTTTLGMDATRAALHDKIRNLQILQRDLEFLEEVLGDPTHPARRPLAERIIEAVVNASDDELTSHRLLAPDAAGSAIQQ